MTIKMKTFISKYIKKSGFCLAIALPLTCGITSCSDAHMAEINRDNTKSEIPEPNSLLTTALLQTYGDFNLMDTYRSYITGFTQQFAGGWNVTNYAGSVHYADDQARLIWSRYYSVALNLLAQGINASANQPALNAMQRIHRVYLMSIITDIYGDVPYSEASKGYLENIRNPKYDTQKDIYYNFFDELAACIAELDKASTNVTGDVSSYNGDVKKWQKYANSLRMRFAMRISDVDPTKAQEEFEKAMNDSHGYIATAADNAYIKYMDASFTFYKGSEKYDFRTNALGGTHYGQDSESPGMICSTFFEQMQKTNDPRLYRICRHYINLDRSEIKPDRLGNVDVTEAFAASQTESPCNPGAAWYDEWVSAPANGTFAPLDADPRYRTKDYDSRMMRPFLSIDFEMPDRPGILITSAEVNFLLAEAKTKGWNVSGDAETYYENGVRESMEMLNDYYLESNKISEAEINSFIENNKLSATNPKETINTQAWILHLMNPAEAWANMRRSDYPRILDRSRMKLFKWTYDDTNLKTPTRLRYPLTENELNGEQEKIAIDRMGGTDDWHNRVWWDTKEQNYISADSRYTKNNQ
jgi:hypothetical protein